MKIGLVIYPINDLGGIINHVENLAFGLRELGHQVGFHILCWQSTFRNSYREEILLKEGWVRGAFCAVHQQKGWNAEPWVHKLSYFGKKNLERTKEILSRYDLIIWEIPVPTKSNANEGNFDWVDLYSACDKNIAVLHDGNLFGIPWIVGVRKYFCGIACVHECSFNLARRLDIPRSLILNPQDLSGMEELYDYSERKDGFLSLQVFKSWKHVDDLIRAIPYMGGEFRKIVAGGGIEQRYMVSRDKVKERYLCYSRYDPDLPKSVESSRTRIWDRARYYGMEYLGFISPFRRDILLSQVKTLVDPSWSRNYNKFGSHFNRVIVDGMKIGVIPIAVNLGMSRDESGKGMVFSPEDNYIMIPYDSPPKEYAMIVEYGSHLTKDEYSSILSNNYALLGEFDRRKIAQDFIDLSMEKGCGFLGKRFRGTLDSELKKKSDEGIKFFRKKNFRK